MEFYPVCIARTHPKRGRGLIVRCLVLNETFRRGNAVENCIVDEKNTVIFEKPDIFFEQKSQYTLPHGRGAPPSANGSTLIQEKNRDCTKSNGNTFIENEPEHEVSCSC